MTDPHTTISEVKIFLENLKSDLPEVFSQRTAQPDLPFAKRLLFRGEIYDVKVIDTPGVLADIKIEDGIVSVSCDTKRVHPRNALESWLRAQAEALFSERVKFWAEKMAVEYQKVSVKDQRTLWGSCSRAGNLSFSWRLIKTPSAVLDYLVVHELAHLVHPNHTPDYWALVAQWCPDHKEYRRWLNSHKDDLFSDVETPASPPPSAS